MRFDENESEADQAHLKTFEGFRIRSTDRLPRCRHDWLDALLPILATKVTVALTVSP
jgi:hypothetical protein